MRNLCVRASYSALARRPRFFVEERTEFGIENLRKRIVPGLASRMAKRELQGDKGFVVGKFFAQPRQQFARQDVQIACRPEGAGQRPAALTQGSERWSIAAKGIQRHLQTAQADANLVNTARVARADRRCVAADLGQTLQDG